MARRRRVAVVGAGWAGLAAALECAASGLDVSVFEMAPIAGGRARDVGTPEDGLDNGQHICIGAYVETLRMVKMVGVAESEAFVRLPLQLVDAAGRGLRLGRGPARWAFARAVLTRHGWSWRERAALLIRAGAWAQGGFTCDARSTVADLAAGLPRRLRTDLLDPLCIAALNTPAEEASGTVFLRVLRDALAGGAGASDLLLPRRQLGAVLPQPAVAHLRLIGASVSLAHRIERIETHGGQWEADGQLFDRIVLASSPIEAARLAAPVNAAWAERAAALRYEPIVTVYASSAGTRLDEPMLLLQADAERPAQFVFDRGRLGGPEGTLAFVISGAASWVERGIEATERAVLAQASSALAGQLRGPLLHVRTIQEKRATFRCIPGLQRPPMRVAPGCVAAGDYVDGPYPSTLEGAVRSGVAAAHAAIA
ncbi:MAG: hydroxysqualene dehydroxylase HpnE [Pseudomonadota bacterium]|nr:hydroxysqualene dehydroxylase HpnE [Pseudomonadota bacterium]